MLFSRYVKFYRSLVSSPKFSVRFLARLVEGDHRTVLGKTLAYLCRECGLKSCELDKLTPGLVRRCVGFGLVPENEEWVAGVATELLHIRNSELILDGFSKAEIDEMLDFMCVS